MREVERVIDTVFDVLEFKKLLEKYKVDPSEVRICVKRVGRELFHKVQVVLTVGVFEDEMPRKILRCIVDEKIFTAANEEAYVKWVNGVLEETYGKLGFKPVEGYWEW